MCNNIFMLLGFVCASITDSVKDLFGANAFLLCYIAEVSTYFFYPSFFMLIFCLIDNFLSVRLSICLFANLTLCIFGCFSICLLVYLSVSLFVCLPICLLLAVYLFVCLSICLLSR